MSNLTFREQCALVALERFADKMFDKQFQRESWDAGVEPEEMIATYVFNLTHAMCEAMHPSDADT